MAETALETALKITISDASSSNITCNIQEQSGQQTTSIINIHKPSCLSSLLTRLNASYFRITISFGGQALLWKILSEHNNNGSQEVSWHLVKMLPSTVFLLLWWLALLLLISFSLLYVLKCLFHFDMVKKEFFHYIGVNYLYAPWISWLLLFQSSPITIAKPLNHLAMSYIFAIPVMILDVKLYGQWFTTEKKFLSRFANPTSQITVLGNLVVARAVARMGWKESALCMFSLGIVHYLVLFVTLYQRLSGGNNFPALLRPAFFLFFAVPSMASLAWTSIAGVYDASSKMLFFLSLFLFMSLACRPALFKKSMKKFTVAWWAYSFTLTFLALASTEYAKEVKGHFAFALMLVLSAISVFVFLGLMLLTAINTDRLLWENDPVLSFADNSTNAKDKATSGRG